MQRVAAGCMVGVLLVVAAAAVGVAAAAEREQQCAGRGIVDVKMAYGIHKRDLLPVHRQKRPIGKRDLR